MKRSRWRARGEGVYPRMSHHCLGKGVMRYAEGSRSSQSVWGGGVAFLEFFHEFLSVCDKKSFGKTLELNGPSSKKIGQSSGDFGHKSKFEFSKITVFGLWDGNFCTFFFQNSKVKKNLL